MDGEKVKGEERFNFSDKKGRYRDIMWGRMARCTC
jgi:hypothetical protein